MIRVHSFGSSSPTRRTGRSIWCSGFFSLPKLQVEDAMNGRQRAKLEAHEDRAFVVLKELRYDDDASAVETGQVAVSSDPATRFRCAPVMPPRAARGNDWRRTRT